ncbi:putative RTA1 domain protein [Lineolata rhizophorae]|uniref:Putative RTA1 domain protein n=1 Tax=Lineolata rhizophorae TaxID=578093 RepID=A0A6A6NM79_9PEZI|nr:putative RTA1 domain protein [Lineolata rhizophorae]
MAIMHPPYISIATNTFTKRAPSEHGYYEYDPSVAGNAIFMVLFLIATLGHIWRIWHFRSRYFIPFVVGGLFETAGYAARIYSRNHLTLGPYVVQSVLILVAPALFAATIYMILGRIVRLVHAPHHSIFKPTIVTKVFVCGDVFCFLVQSGGGGLQAQEGNRNLGRAIVLVGLVAQILIFGFFIVVAGVFHVRTVKAPTEVSPRIPWRKHMFMLYLTSALIMVRNLVRVVEYAQGYSGYIITHEWCLFVFDSLLMFAAMLALFIAHPGSLIGRSPESKAVDAEGMRLASRDAGVSEPHRRI